jgi:hypothetical protein
MPGGVRVVIADAAWMVVVQVLAKLVLAREPQFAVGTLVH